MPVFSIQRALASFIATAVFIAPAVFARPDTAVAADSGRMRLRAVENGREIPYTTVRIGTETRVCLAPSGRRSLGLRPTQVATGGRVFVYGRLPADLVGRDFDAEALLWTQGREAEGDEPAVAPGWRRVGILPSAGGGSAFLSETLVVQDMNPGAVASELFKRTPVPVVGNVLRTAPVLVPRLSRLRFGYTLDEYVWDGLVSASVEIVARTFENGQPTGDRISLLRKEIDPAAGEPRWFDQAVDLGRLGGRTVAFEFHSFAERPRAGKLQPHVVWSSPEIVHDRGALSPPSVVLISLASVRASSMSCCGGERETTPFLQSAFGNQGAIFDRAVTQSVETIPANMSLLTSTYASVHGVQTAAFGLSDRIPTLTQAMSDAGRLTAAFVDGGGLAPELGFGRGFDVYAEDAESDPWEIHGRAAATFERAISWIESHSNDPFFVFVQTAEARPPYVPPAAYLDFFKDARLATPSDVDEGALVRYEREIRYLDDVIRKFVVKLDQLVDPDRVLLVVTSGHGESFGEHGALGNGTQLYDESLRVPLMMRGLGIRAGARYPESIGLIDVAPTVAELAGVAVPQTMQGESVANELKSGLPVSVPPRYAEARARVRRTPDGDVTDWGRPSYATVDSSRKVIWNAGLVDPTFEAYDVVADPEELRSVAGAGQPAWVSQMSEDVKGYPAACRNAAKPPLESPEIDPATRLKLRAFGYID